MDTLKSLNKEKAVCMAAAALLALTAYALVAYALQERSLPAAPTAGGVELHRPGELSLKLQCFSRFWDFGPRNPFQPVIDAGASAGAQVGEHADGLTGRKNAEHGDPVRSDTVKETADRGSPENQADEIKPNIADRTGDRGLEMPLSLKGTIKVGRRAALVENAQTGSLTRCRVGDVVCGMTVVGIRPTSVIVQDRHGALHVLPDAFRLKYDCDKGSRAWEFSTN